MLSLVVTLLIIALIAAVLGFGGIAGAAVGIAKIVFFVALVLFIISLIAGGMRRLRPAFVVPDVGFDPLCSWGSTGRSSSVAAFGISGPKRVLRKQRPDSRLSRRHSHLYHYVGLPHPLGAPALLPGG